MQWLLTIPWKILDLKVEIECECNRLATAVASQFGAFERTNVSSTSDLRYAIRCDPRHVEDRGSDCCDAALTLFLLEKRLSIDLQLRRSDLLFLHAGALERAGQALLLVGESGAGKSTTTWGLLHHGFSYLTDELSPVRSQDLTVYAYPRAISMKRHPPSDYPLPDSGLLDLGRTIHIPFDALPTRQRHRESTIAAIFFVQHDPCLSETRARRLGSAEAAARAYVAALNPLSHPGKGMDAAIWAVKRVPCWAVDASGLASTCELISDLFQHVPAQI